MSAEELANKLARTIESLFDRWRDEWMYEDWSDYEDHARKAVEKDGGEFIHFNKKPFVLRFKKDDQTMEIEVNVRELKVTKINT
jgi:hypothetical protein